MAKVLLCSDESILAEGLARILASSEALDLTSYCHRIDDLRPQMEQHKPDILLVDLTAGITFGDLSGLHEVASHARIVLWVHSISTELALQAMSLGVRGILRKTLPVDTLMRCLTRVNDGELWFEKALTDSIMSTGRYSLTRREGQLVILLSQGLKNKEVATALNISEGTVKVYLSRLFQKLGVKDRFELALYGLKNLTPGGGLIARSAEPGRAKPGTQVWQPPRSFFVERMPVRQQTSDRRPISQVKL
jgi:DNA-binding NarL/FixJ family response regulator